MKIQTALLLASESPRRKELLTAAGVKFSVFPAAVQELENGSEPEKLPELNAILKAEAVAEQFPECWVIGADTGVFADDLMLGKPKSDSDAVRMLSLLQNRTHRVISGVALLNRKAGIKKSWSCVTDVTFGPLSPAEITGYMKVVNVMDKAGAYGIQEHPEMLKVSWHGELENVIGLPLLKLTAELKNIGCL